MAHAMMLPLSSVAFSVRTTAENRPKKRPLALPQAAKSREETPKEGIGKRLAHRNNMHVRCTKSKRVCPIFLENWIGL
jgi:hypothetical protein